AETPERAAEREPQIVRVKTGRLAEVMRDEMKPQYLAQGPRRQAVLNLCMDMAETLGADVFIRQSRALQRRRDQQSTLRKIKCPVLILCGEHDQLCTPARHQFMAELIPYSVFKVVGGAGHLPTLEQPELVTRLLNDWLAQPLVLR
ncbi:MAG: alpha/beta hydrolase, partial [Pseudomonadota bacterium]